MKRLMLAAMLLFVTSVCSAQFLEGQPTKEEQKEALLRYVFDSYSKGSTPLYRGVLEKCDGNYQAWYLHMESGKELFIEDTADWPDHWQRVAETFGYDSDPETAYGLEVMQLDAKVAVCPKPVSHSEFVMNVDSLPQIKLLGGMIPMPLSMFETVADGLKAESPDAEFWMLYGVRCTTDGVVGKILGPNDQEAMDLNVSSDEDMFALAAAVWPEIEDWYAVDGVQSQLQPGLCVYIEN